MEIYWLLFLAFGIFFGVYMAFEFICDVITYIFYRDNK